MPLGYSRAVFTLASFRSIPKNFRHKCASLFASVNTATALGRAPKRSTTPRRGGLGTAICELWCVPFVHSASCYYFTYYYVELDHRHDTPGRIWISLPSGVVVIRAFECSDASFFSHSRTSLLNYSVC